jgi:TPR repeat protein
MASPEQGDKPATSPLDAEREKLRKAGYNETEISQILVARALSSSGHSEDAPTGQGVMSGTLSSVMAIGSYARGTVFTIRHDLATIFDRTALASARVGSAVMLVFKVAVISVLAFAGWQEWQRHIISEPDIAKQQTVNLTEQAKNAPVRENAIADNVAQQAKNAERREAAIAESAVAEAKIKEATAREALRRQKAEADEAVARACSTRLKAVLDTQPMDKAFAAAETIQRECDPAGAEHAKTCDALYEKTLRDYREATVGAVSEDIAMLEENKCSLTQAQIDAFGFSSQSKAPAAEVKTSPPTPTGSTAEPRPDPLAAGSPVPDPDVEAVRHYKLAADRGDADAQLNLGRMYGTGRGGLAPDPREAARLYKLSADQGNAVAQLQLAYMYENGDVLPKDWPEAARLYRLAADQGNPEAQANLADFYERGDAGLRRNACEAVRLRKLAAAQGNAYAAKNLKEASATRCKP